MKLKPQISIYKISKKFFIRNNDQILELELDANAEKILEYLKFLEGGVESDFIGRLDDSDRNEFDELISFLSQNNLLCEFKNGEETRENQMSKKIISGDIYILSKDQEFRKTLKDILNSNELSQSDKENHSGLVIYVKSSKTKEEDIIAFNNKSLATGRPWLLVDISMESYGMLGPMIIPKITACYECFTKRSISNGDLITLHDMKEKEYIIIGSSHLAPWKSTLLASLIAHEIDVDKKSLTPASTGSILYIDFQTLDVWKESLLRWPYCEKCNEI